MALTTNQFSSSTFPPPPPPIPPRKYEVFLSFRGEDTRKSFTGHLYAALNARGIYTFMDDEELERGKSISPELLKAIEESSIAVVILSRNYASSKWCLDELAKIVMSGLIVLPVFYDVEPTHVRKQSGDFEKAFAEYEKVLKDEAERIKKWREAFAQVGSISGWDIQDRYEAKVIDEIVENISRKLNHTLSTSDFKDFVGMDRINKIELDMSRELDDREATVIGICGMSGIGKTTIAQVLFERIHNKFEASCFIHDVREMSEWKILPLVQKKLYGNLSNNKVSVEDVNGVRSRLLGHKRVLIILDDVDNVKQIEAVVGCGARGLYDRFGQGSRIIVTTKDKSLLKAYEPKIHMVGKLNYDEALMLFSQRAFGRDRPVDEYLDLSYQFVDYAAGLPLALTVFGSFLFGRSLTEWCSELDRLKKNPGEQLLHTLRVGFDGLASTDEKDIFLDIACFFKGQSVKRVKRIFESCDYYPDISIRVLLEKSLLTIFGGKLWMHHLLQEMGKDIVRKQSQQELGKRSRLWLHEDAVEVLTTNEGTKFVEGIFLSSPEQYDSMDLTTDPFVRMSNLRLLKISNVNFSGCHESLSNKLRLLDWYGYPLKSLPSSFNPKKLVELHLPQSRIEKLWNEIREPLEKLVIMDLSDCEDLTKTPNFTDEIPKLERLILQGCKKLSHVHPSVGALQRLILLNLQGCQSLGSLPHKISLRSLKTFILSGCYKLKRFPEIDETMKQLSELHLDGTAIKELPTSIKYLTGLILLNLKDCKNLLSLPGVICTLKSLQILNISGCSKLEELPEQFRSLESLVELDAGRSGIRQVPSSIVLLKNLKVLSLAQCGGLPHNPWGWLFSCCLLPSEPSTGLQLPASFSGLCSLRKLDLSFCNLSEGALPDDIGCLSSLTSLNLSGNNFRRIPESLCQLTELKELILDNCSKLLSLPTLPLNLLNVSVLDCPLLRRYFPNDESTVWISPSTGFTFIDYQRGETRKLRRIPGSNEHVYQHVQKWLEGLISDGYQFSRTTSETEIPAWLSHSSTTGSSIRIPLPADSDDNVKWMGLAFFFVCVVQEHDNINLVSTCHSSLISYPSKPNGRLLFDIYTNEGPIEGLSLVQDIYLFTSLVPKTQSLVIYTPRQWFNDRVDRECFTRACYIRASVIIDSPGVDVKACATRLIYKEDVTDVVKLNGEKTNSIGPTDHMKNPLTCSVEENSNEYSQVLVEEETTSQVEFLIPIQPYISTYSSSPKIVGQLRRNVESALEQIFKGRQASIYDYGFVLSLRAILPWFSHRSTGMQVKLHVPPDLCNNQEWVGFAMYVSFTLPPAVYLSKHGSKHFVFYCCLRTYLEASKKGPVHYVTLVAPEEKFVGSQLVTFVIHISRTRFRRQLMNQWEGIIADFFSVTKGVEVELCGIRLVYEQDLKGLIQTITQCAINSPPVYYQRSDETVVLEGGERFSFLHMTGSLLEKAKSMASNFLDTVGCPFPLQRRLRPMASREAISTVSESTIPTPRQWFDNRVYRECLTPACYIRASVIQGRCAAHLIYKEDVTEFVQVVWEKTLSIGLIDHMKNPLTCSVEENFNEYSQVLVTSQEEPTYVAQRARTSEARFLIPIQPHISTDSSSPKIVGQLRRGVESALEQIFKGRQASIYDYGFVLSLRAILPWFSHQSTGRQVKLHVPPDLCNNKEWVGFAMYVSFTIPPAVYLSKQGSEHLVFCCYLRTYVEASKKGPVHHVALVVPPEEKFVGSQRVTFVIHISRTRFRRRLMNQWKGIIAVFSSVTEGVEVELCGIRLVYEQDLKGLIQTITQCAINSPPVYYQRSDETVVLEGGERFSFLHMTGSLLEKAKSMGSNFLDTVGCPFPLQRRIISFRKLRPIASLEAISTVSESTVGEVIHLLIFADDSPINQALKVGDSVIQWKRNLECLLQCFFALSLRVSVNLSLRGNLISSLECMNPPFEYNSVFPQNEIPKWFESQDPEFHIPKSQNYNSWMGLAVCSHFLVSEHPTSVKNNMDSRVPQKLTCHIRIATGYCLALAPPCLIFRHKFTWLYRRGFIWLLYIPRSYLGLSTFFNASRELHVHSESDHPGLWTRKTSFRLLYKQDMKEFKQTLIHCVTSFFDDEDLIQQFIEDEDAKIEKRSLQVDNRER